ncbi:cell wall hydrolase [Ammoniphilus sp. YIM 78166]|uniref:cell wall hydrolase n=1 Tax=Ammoniphilus sp. YIM 78166 TaxID=1644106 RepID=UPI00106F58C6|nr:cell wall hydrolase [Ammoniphilus sp. YIM 78166]
MRSRWLCLIYLCSIVISMGISNSQASAKGTTILVDGKSVPSIQVNQEGRISVSPVFFQRIGVSVDWSSKDLTFQLKEGEVELTILPGDISSEGYIPLRYVAEQLGMEVTYDAPTSSVHILTGRTVNDQATKNTEIFWLYQLTEAEAGGESYEGKVAVAATVLNRVKNSDYPNTIKDVIFQVIPIQGVDYYQFSPVKDERIYSVVPSNDTIAAVNDALKGSDPSKGSIVFFNPKKTSNEWVRKQPVKSIIGNHVFAG